MTSRIVAIVCCLPLLAGCAASAGQLRHHAAGSPVFQPPATRPSSAPSLPAAGQVVHTVHLSPELGNPDGMAGGFGSLWVGGYGGDAVAQLDPADGTVIRTVKVGTGPIGVYVIGGSVWAASYQGDSVSKIDPATGRVAKVVRVGQSPDSLAIVGGQLWVFDQASSAATVLDPATGHVVRTVRLPVQSGFAAAGAGRVWVPDLNGGTQTVVGLDRRTGKIVTTVHTGAYPSEVTFGFGSGWVTCQGSVMRFDPATGAVMATIRAPGAGFDGIAVSGGAIWVGDLLGGLVDRISPATNAITASVRVGGGPRHIVAERGDLWVALFDAGEVVRLRPGR